MSLGNDLAGASRLMRAAGALVCAAALCGGVTGATINVPADHATIQAAINAAGTGDELVVAAGTYRELLNLKGKAITLRSTDPTNPAVVAATILTGDLDDDPDTPGAGTVIKCTSSEGPDTVISGLTITGGHATWGGGMYCLASYPTVEYCTFTGNTATQWGAGLCFFGERSGDGSGARVESCTFTGNTSGNYGGGCMSSQAVTEFYSCLFQNNSAAESGAGLAVIGGSSLPGRVDDCVFTGNTATTHYGGGMYLANEWKVKGCTFTGNTAGKDGGGLYNSGGRVEDCTFGNNSATDGGGLVNSGGTVSSCTIENNTAGGDGGGIDNRNGGTVSDCDVRHNTATGFGGGIYCDGGAAAHDNVVCGNVPDQVAPPYSGVGSNIERDWCDSGACCVGATCILLDPVFCAVVGGVDMGEGSDCESGECAGGATQTGACCVGFTCVVIEETSCAAAGGVYSGDGVTCAAAGCPEPPPTGACCIGSACVVTEMVYCDVAGGVFTADGMLCEFAQCPEPPPAGACCVAGQCVVLAQVDCEGIGGTYEGDGTACGPIECPDPCVCDITGDGLVDRSDLFEVLFNYGSCDGVLLPRVRR